MKATQKRRVGHIKPKHKHTKEYLKHYYPFIPLFISIIALIMVLFSPARVRNDVLAYSTDISHSKLLDATNGARATDSADPLRIDERLQDAAQAKANDMTTRNYWSHQTPEGKEPWMFVAESGYEYVKAGENLAFGFANSQEVIDGWLNSPTHRRNMLDRAYSEVGFGIANSPNFNGTGPATVIVALYGLPVSQATGLTTSDTTNILSGEAGTIRTIQLYTRASWVTYAIGAVIGAGIMYLLVTHSLTLRRVVAKGERFIIRNPVLDSIVIALLAAGILLMQTAGSIH